MPSLANYQRLRPEIAAMQEKMEQGLAGDAPDVIESIRRSNQKFLSFIDQQIESHTKWEESGGQIEGNRFVSPEIADNMGAFVPQRRGLIINYYR